MRFILEYKKWFDVEDIVWIEYWYEDILTPCKVLEKSGNKYLITHNIEESKIKNAPDEWIKSTDVIDYYRK
jgi:hypothetical protein